MFFFFFYQYVHYISSILEVDNKYIFLLSINANKIKFNDILPLKTKVISEHIKLVNVSCIIN